MKFIIAVLFVFSCILSGFAYAEDLPRFRGVVISPNVNAKDLEDLGTGWNANFISWQLTLSNSKASTASLAEYDAWLESALQHLDSLLPVCERQGLKVMIALYTSPGGRNSKNESRIFLDQNCQQHLLKVWDKIAARYAGNQTVWGYDLVGEPIEGTIPDGLMNWRQLATQVATNIRKIDKTHVIVVEPDKWALPEAFIGFTPLPSTISNVVYNVHMYTPHKFTHQGLPGNVARLKYPGVIDSKMWSKNQMIRYFQPVVDFQNKYGARILVGEFSAIRWAAGGSAFHYIKDLIDICETNRWGWVYHAFREFDGWSVEHTEDRNNLSRSKTQTNREKLLRFWFSKNLHY